MDEWCGVSRTHNLLFQTYRHLDMQGEIVEIIEQGANEHINALSKKCLGKDHDLAALQSEGRCLPAKVSSKDP
jgi:hypothetical protein